MMETKQTPIRFPRELLREIDSHIGRGERSKFIIDATRKELLKVKQQKALKKVRGVLTKDDYPEFESSGTVSEWVRELREQSEKYRRELFDED